jgi:CRISPR-associated protein Csx17
MTQRYVHVLRGCAPTPLAHYLKALGVLRLVCEQIDADARGAWVDDEFRLVTKLTREELVSFFADKYEPTPLLSPWNGGSGFYPGDNQEGFGPLKNARAPRLRPYREAIAQAQQTVGARKEKPGGDEKAALLRACVSSWDGPAYGWLRSSFTIGGDGSPSFPALLGTGGNDGRLDFTNNYMQRLVGLIDAETGAVSAEARTLLTLSLFRDAAPGLADNAIGQFFPGAAGGANAGAGFDGGALINPWDFVLMLEGALVLRVASLRRLDTAELTNAAAPYALRCQGVGYGSASPADASARGEQWMPLWSGAATLGEVESLFEEGRLHGGKRPVRGTIDAARSVAKLGVSRGVKQFVRYGYFERNGLSNLAIPIGRITVAHDSHVALLDEIDGFARTLERAAGQKTAPASMERTQRRLEAAMLQAATPNASGATWEALLGTLGEVEALYLASPRSTASSNVEPLPVLSAAWLERLPEAAEVRLAIAIASQTSEKLGPLRKNVVPYEGERFPKFRKGADALVQDPQVVWSGGDLVSNLLAVASRRAIDGTRERSLGFPLEGRRFATLADIADFLRGATDDARIARLLRGLLSISWGESRPPERTSVGEPSALHALVRLAFLPRKLEPAALARRPEDRNLPPLRPVLDGAILRLLEAGRVSEAVERILARLIASGARPTLRTVAASPALARRLAASVAIPVSPADQVRLLRAVCKPFSEKTKDEAHS